MWHTGSRWDRDNYVTIVWENIVPGREYNFHDDTLLGFPYFDYGSIMKLDNGFYSKNGNDTVLSPEPIGQVDHLTTGVMSCGCVCCTSVDLDPECTTTI
jgi:hypothetical protein